MSILQRNNLQQLLHFLVNSGLGALIMLMNIIYCVFFDGYMKIRKVILVNTICK